MAVTSFHDVRAFSKISWNDVKAKSKTLWFSHDHVTSHSALHHKIILAKYHEIKALRLNTLSWNDVTSEGAIRSQGAAKTLWFHDVKTYCVLASYESFMGYN